MHLSCCFQQPEFAAKNSFPARCCTAGQHSDVESEHGLVEEIVAVRPRRRCSTLTERRHAAGASLAVGAPDTTSERRISLRVGHSKRNRASGESSIQRMPRLFLSPTSIRMVCVLAGGAIVETRHVVEHSTGTVSARGEQIYTVRFDSSRTHAFRTAETVADYIVACPSLQGITSRRKEGLTPRRGGSIGFPLAHNWHQIGARLGGPQPGSTRNPGTGSP